MKKSDHSMRVRPPSRSRRAAVAGPLAAALVVACLCGTSPEEAQLFAQRRQRIAGLTHTEVEQLKRNYEEFRKLPPDRRKALEELNDEVKQDASGRLLKLLAGYNRWFSGLSPFDQERILSKTDPVERAQLVKVIRDDQLKRQAAAAFDGLGRQSLSLAPSDLDATIKAVEENFLTPESRKKISDQLKGRDRHLRILQLAAQQVHNSPGGPRQADQALVSTLIDGIPSETVKTRIMNRTQGRPRRQFLGQMLGRALVSEWRKEIEQVFPTPAAIDAEVARRLKATREDRREQQQLQMSGKPGRTMVGVQMLLLNDEQFKALRPIFFWLIGGLSPRANANRLQQAMPPDDAKGEEAENRAKLTE
jgi:hypothetical protein